MALSRFARVARTLSATRLGAAAGLVTGALGGGRVADVDGAGAGSGDGARGDAHADTTSTTAAIFMLLSFAVAHTASIVTDESGRTVRMKDVTIASIGELNAFTSRRGFLQLMGAGGALVLLPGLFAACDDSSNTGGISGPGSGATLSIDFSGGDVAVMQFAYLLEQLEADFYSRVVASFATSDVSKDEQAVLVDIRNHEIIHREFLKAALGSNGNFTVAPIYGTTNFNNRVSVLTAARDFEELGIAAYNGAAQYIADVNNLLIAGKIVSVEARHAAAIRDLITPLGSDFAPTPFDNAFSPTKVVLATQTFVENRLEFANAPSTFVEGPNNNG
ncbi:MAG: ferritin-like domain-containing protein [bacterium]